MTKKSNKQNVNLALLLFLPIIIWGIRLYFATSEVIDKHLYYPIFAFGLLINTLIYTVLIILIVMLIYSIYKLRK